MGTRLGTTASVAVVDELAGLPRDGVEPPSSKTRSRIRAMRWMISGTGAGAPREGEYFEEPRESRAAGRVGVEEMNDDSMTLWRRDGLELPLRNAPIRFAVQKRNGITSNSWGIGSGSKGDVYIYCRDGLKGQKVSLHASGRQHISFSLDAPSMKSYAGDRFMNRWEEPQYTKKAVPTLRLLFPPWGLGRNAEQRETVQAVWDKNDILIPGHDEMVTVVSFVITDDGKSIRKEKGSPPSAPFGVLRMRPGKYLAVIAGYEPEGDLREKVDAALKTIASTTDPKLLEGEDLNICLTGNSAENCTFLLPLAVRYAPSDA